MGKKTDTSKQAGESARASKPAAKKPKKAAVAAPVVATGIAPAAPKTVKAVAKKPVKKASPAKKPAYTPDDVALRAYFIAEKRQKAGLPGDSTSDWVEAERQLLAESKKKKAVATA